MDTDSINIVFADNLPPSFDPTGTLLKSVSEPKRGSAGSIVLVIVAGLLSIFVIASYMLFVYAQKSVPPRKKKPVSTKRIRRQKKLKNGVFPSGD